MAGAWDTQLERIDDGKSVQLVCARDLEDEPRRIMRFDRDYGGGIVLSMQGNKIVCITPEIGCLLGQWLINDKRD